MDGRRQDGAAALRQSRALQRCAGRVFPLLAPLPPLLFMSERPHSLISRFFLPRCRCSPMTSLYGEERDGILYTWL